MRVTVHHFSFMFAFIGAILGSGCQHECNDESSSAAPSVSNSLSKSLLGVSGRSSKKTSAESCGDSDVVFRALSYNAALAPGFELLSQERTPKVIDSLAEEAKTADLLCVQEFWTEDAFNALRAKVPELSEAIHMAPRPGTGTCEQQEFASVAGCLSTSCAEAQTDELVGCASMACASEVSSLSGGCLGCILNHLDNVEACLAESAEPPDPAIFGGAFDVGLLSRHPIARQATRELSSYFVRASVLYGRVTVPSFGAVDVFCTHLGSPLGIVGYGGKFGDWTQEHLRQVDELVAFIREKSSGAHPIVLLGDLNMGPAVGANEAELGDQYQRLINAGFDNAYTRGTSPDCTYCGGTTFRSESSPNQIIDHILTSRLPLNYLEVARVLTEPVELGDPLPAFHLSDHFGLKLRIHSHP